MDETVRIVYERLIEVARAKSITNYSDVGQLVGLDMGTEVGRIRIAQILDDINHYEHGQNGPMLSAVVIRQDINMPGSGFFECARGLGRDVGDNELLFWINQLNQVHNYWQSH
jgi:hypothetical protein